MSDNNISSFKTKFNLYSTKIDSLEKKLSTQLKPYLSILQGKLQLKGKFNTWVNSTFSDDAQKLLNQCGDDIQAKVSTVETLISLGCAGIDTALKGLIADLGKSKLNNVAIVKSASNVILQFNKFEKAEKEVAAFFKDWELLEGKNFKESKCKDCVEDNNFDLFNFLVTFECALANCLGKFYIS